MEGYYNYDYYDYSSLGGVDNTSLGIFAAISGGMLLFSGILVAFMLICMWKVFKKAGKPGWASIVPVYNIIVLLEIVELPIWYIALFLVPFANIYAMFKMYIELAHKFGKSTGFGVGLVFLSIIFYPILAFGSATYSGNSLNSEGEKIQPNQDQNMNQVNNNIQNSTVMDFNNFNNGANLNNSSNGSFAPVGDLNNNMNNIQDSQTISVPETPVIQTTPGMNPVPETPIVQATPGVNPVPETPIVQATPGVNPVPETPVVPATPAINPVPETPVVSPVSNNGINNNQQ